MAIAWRPRAFEVAEAREEPGSDDALVATAQASPGAFAALWERYYEPVFRYCRYRLSSWEDAEDAANEIFADAFAGLPRFRTGRNTFRSWLFAIAHNEIAGRRRRNRLLRFVPFLDQLGRSAAAPSPEAAVELDERVERALRLLAAFPDEQRRVLELRWAGLSGKEIAAVLGKRHDAVRQIESRAAKRLRELREEEDHGG